MENLKKNKIYIDEINKLGLKIFTPGIFSYCEKSINDYEKYIEKILNSLKELNIAFEIHSGKIYIIDNILLNEYKNEIEIKSRLFKRTYKRDKKKGRGK